MDNAKLLHQRYRSVLHDGSPSPLWIASSYLHLDVIEFLLSHLTNEQVDEKSPDGTTALMQMCAGAKKYGKEKSKKVVQLITRNKHKFETGNISKAAIYFGHLELFKNVSSDMSTTLARDYFEIAVQSNSCDILKFLLNRYPSVNDRANYTALSSQSLKVRTILGTPNSVPSEQTQLCTMSMEFPVFNDKVEEEISPIDPNTAQIDIENDIIPHLKEKFCPLRCYGLEPKAIPICDWRPTNCIHEMYVKFFQCEQNKI